VRSRCCACGSMGFVVVRGEKLLIFCCWVIVLVLGNSFVWCSDGAIYDF